MKLIDFHNYKVEDKSVITFGNFDGLHLGHDTLIKKLLNIAKKDTLKSILITFKPHTRSIISEDKRNSIIVPYKFKIDLLKGYNIDYISTINFNEEFSKIEANTFIDNILNSYNPSVILIGYDNRFGYKGKGDYKFLKEYLKSRNVDVIRFDKYNFNNLLIKSTLIKDLIIKGKMERTSCYLGRNFSLYGHIVKGKSRGRKLGFPTANLKLLDKEQIIPKVGLYYVNFIDGYESYKALCNVGYRPTFDNDRILSIESYVIENENFNFYNKEIKIEFLKYLRDEIAFSSKEELIKQIENDIISVKQVTD